MYYSMFTLRTNFYDVSEIIAVFLVFKYFLRSLDYNPISEGSLTSHSSKLLKWWWWKWSPHFRL